MYEIHGTGEWQQPVNIETHGMWRITAWIWQVYPQRILLISEPFDISLAKGATLCACPRHKGDWIYAQNMGHRVPVHGGQKPTHLNLAFDMAVRQDVKHGDDSVQAASGLHAVDRSATQKGVNAHVSQHLNLHVGPGCPSCRLGSTMYYHMSLIHMTVHVALHVQGITVDYSK